jgi:peptidoglycan/xylan/chitin deacetylase (PgdA/CDA1 family)
LGITLGQQEFEAAIRFLVKHYTPVELSAALGETRSYSRPPVLVTFDDAYASVAMTAAPILKRYNVPAVFFVNASLIGNHDLALDNLVCYVANTHGIGIMRGIAYDLINFDPAKVNSLEDIFTRCIATMPQTVLMEFRRRLIGQCAIDTATLACRAQMYINAEQLRELVSSHFEIGNHTYSHTFCRSLCDQDFEKEICANKAILEEITGGQVRAFSVPYGESADVTEELIHHLRWSGHEALFLVESRCNRFATDAYGINRVSVHGRTDAELFVELEIFPRLRSFRDLLLSGPKLIYLPS